MVYVKLLYVYTKKSYNCNNSYHDGLVNSSGIASSLEVSRFGFAHHKTLQIIMCCWWSCMYIFIDCAI